MTRGDAPAGAPAAAIAAADDAGLALASADAAVDALVSMLQRLWAAAQTLAPADMAPDATVTVAAVDVRPDPALAALAHKAPETAASIAGALASAGMWPLPAALIPAAAVGTHAHA